MGVAAIAKPPRRWCGHFRRGRGCDIYSERPHECGAFNCVWLLTEVLDDDWRPDRAGFVMHTDSGSGRLIVESDPSRPHDWRRAPFEARLRGWAAAGTEVLVFNGDAGQALADERDGDRPMRRAPTDLSASSDDPRRGR